jgi:hypothetical protein
MPRVPIFQAPDISFLPIDVIIASQLPCKVKMILTLISEMRKQKFRDV